MIVVPLMGPLEVSCNWCVVLDPVGIVILVVLREIGVSVVEVRYVYVKVAVVPHLGGRAAVQRRLSDRGGKSVEEEEGREKKEKKREGTCKNCGSSPSISRFIFINF